MFGGALNFLLGESSSSDEHSSQIDPRDLTADEGTMTDTPHRVFLTFGEVYYEYLEVVGGGANQFTRRIAGAELELALELQTAGGVCELFTVLPSGPHGDSVGKYIQSSGVTLRTAASSPGPPIGDLTVTSEGERIFQRSCSAFAYVQTPFRWDKGIVTDRAPCWVHVACSSVMFSDYAKEGWVRLLENATEPKREEGEVLVSLELDSARCSAQVAKIWAFVQPYLPRLDLLLLSPSELLTILQLEQILAVSDFAMGVQALRPVSGCRCIAVTVPSPDGPTLLVAHDSGAFFEKKFPTSSTERSVSGFLVKILMNQHRFIDSEHFVGALEQLTPEFVE